jgi:hypothetical protein
MPELVKRVCGRDGVGPGAALLARILQFMETPQYLRKCALGAPVGMLHGCIMSTGDACRIIGGVGTA